MHTYEDMLNDILKNGNDRGDRTGVGTRSLFGYQNRYSDIGTYFPLVTTRKLNFKQIVGELLWMLSGDTNIQALVKQGFNLWTDWPLKNYNQKNDPLSREEFIEHICNDDNFAGEWGDCGPIYGKQWRAWKGDLKKVGYMDEVDPSHGDSEYFIIDQMKNLIEDLKKNPEGRRHVISAWNVADIPAMIPSGLPPCHCLFQFYCREMTDEERYAMIFDLNQHHLLSDQYVVSEKDKHRAADNIGIPRYKLDCQLYQRSADSVLGVPYNIASYALLTMMIAQQVNMIPGDFIHTFGDVHIYNNHRESLKKQLGREPTPEPCVKIKKAADLFSYRIDDFELIGYDPHPSIVFPIAV